MRKIKLFIACSLDGYIAGKNEEIDWLFTDQDYNYTPFYENVDTTLMGYKSYKLILGLSDDFYYKDKTNYVFTRKSSRDKAPYVTFIHDDIPGFIRQLKEEEGKDIFLVGGGEIIALLHNEGLIDEYIIAFHPLILGEGIPLFKGPLKQQKLKVYRTESYSSGLVHIFYHPVND